MLARILLLMLFIACVPARAADTSPVFGSATQEPVQIAVDPETGLPAVAAAEKPQPIVAAKE